MNNVLLLEVITPEGKVFSGEVSECSFPTAERGYYGILPGHTPLVTPLGNGLITFVEAGKKGVITVFGGFAEVGPDKVVILARESELPSALNVAEQLAKKQAAEAAVKTAQDADSESAAQRALEAATIRLQALGQDGGTAGQG